MARSKYIQSVLDAAGGRPKSTQWFRDKIKEFGTPKSADLIRDGKRTSVPTFGILNMFVYDPKTKAKLPYYDRFPLVLPYDNATGGFYGLNLHYLPYMLRARLLGALIETKDSRTIGPDTQMRYNWNILQSASRFPGVQPTVKRYLFNHIRSRILKVNPENWQTAIMLPVEKFEGAGKQTVFNDSMAAI